jgi:hypothetical protein
MLLIETAAHVQFHESSSATKVTTISESRHAAWSLTVSSLQRDLGELSHSREAGCAVAIVTHSDHIGTSGDTTAAMEIPPVRKADSPAHQTSMDNPSRRNGAIGKGVTWLRVFA